MGWGRGGAYTVGRMGTAVQKWHHHLPAFHSVSQPCFRPASLNLFSVRVLANVTAPC